MQTSVSGTGSFPRPPEARLQKNDSEQSPADRDPPNVFRDEVFVSQRDGLKGEVQLAIPLSFTLLGAVLFSTILTAAVFVTMATYSRIEVVEGWVVPQAGLIRIQARHGGIIESLSVDDETDVDAGSKVAMMKVTSSFQSNDVGRMLWRSAGVEIDSNQEQERLSLEKLRTEQSRLSGQIGVLETALEVAKQHEQTITQRVALLETRAAKAAQLVLKGAITATDGEKAQLEFLIAQQDLSEAQGTTLDLESRITDVRANLDCLPFEIKASEAKARAIDAELEQKQLKTALLNSYEVTAPVSGQVVAVPVMVGQDVAAGATLAVIVPAGSALEVELYFPSRAAGFVVAGQEVRVRYKAFPYQKFGTAKATVRSVSRTILAPGEISTPGVTPKEPAFRVRATLAGTQIQAYGHQIQIRPGMLLSADLVIERRTLFEWMLDPIYAVRRLQ